MLHNDQEEQARVLTSISWGKMPDNTVRNPRIEDNLRAVQVDWDWNVLIWDCTAFVHLSFPKDSFGQVTRSMDTVNSCAPYSRSCVRVNSRSSGLSLSLSANSRMVFILRSWSRLSELEFRWPWLGKHDLANFRSTRQPECAGVCSRCYLLRSTCSTSATPAPPHWQLNQGQNTLHPQSGPQTRI